MAGQDQLIPPAPTPAFEVSPLVPAVPASQPNPQGDVTNVQSGQSPQSQVQNTSPAPSASVGNSAPLADVGTGLLRDIFQSKEQVLGLTAQAMKANNAVDVAASNQMNKLFDSTMEAFNNAKKISRWQDTGLPEVFSLFDSSWNPQYQNTVIQANQVAATQIADRAKTQKEINNQAPALATLSSTLATDAYEAYAKSRDLYFRDTENRIKLEQEGRAERADLVDRLSLQAKQAALVQAKKGQGEFAGMAGILEKSIHDEQQAMGSIESINLGNEQKRSDLVEQGYTRLAGHLPTSFLQPAVNAALKSNAAVVTVPIGGGKTASIPLPIAQQALLDNSTRDATMRAQVAKTMADDAQMPQKINEIASSAAALSSLDPRAGHELTIINRQLSNIDYNDPNAVRTGVSALDASAARIKDIATQASKSYASTEAQNAVQQFVANGGQFTNEGARAVLGDVVGNFGVQNTSKYKGAFDVINRAVAGKIQAQSNSGIAWNAADGGQMTGPQVLAALAQNKAKLKTRELTEEVLHDPTVAQQAINSITNAIMPNALITTMQSLAHDKGAAPIWAQLLHNPENWSTKDANGNMALDRGKLAQALEQQSVATGYKSDYNNAFLTRLQKYGVQADQMAARDPSYSIADRALETALFGARPHSAVVGQLYTDMRALAKQYHEQAKENIQADISGKTDAIVNGRNLAFGPEGGALAAAPAESIAVVPSATGAPLNTQQMRQLFRNGAPQ